MVTEKHDILRNYRIGVAVREVPKKKIVEFSIKVLIRVNNTGFLCPVFIVVKYKLPV